jgi:hypothetical protein
MRLLAGAMLGTVSGVLTGVIAAVVSRRLAPDRLPDSWESGTQQANDAHRGYGRLFRHQQLTGALDPSYVRASHEKGI